MFVSKKKWIELETKVQLITEQLDSYYQNEIQKLRKENEEYRNVKELLKPIKIRVKKAAYSGTSDTVRIEYDIPPVTLEFDNGVQVTKSDFLKSTNILGLVGLEDQMKIQKAIKEAQERRNNEEK